MKKGIYNWTKHDLITQIKNYVNQTGKNKFTFNDIYSNYYSEYNWNNTHTYYKNIDNFFTEMINDNILKVEFVPIEKFTYHYKKVNYYQKTIKESNWTTQAVYEIIKK